ncbi:hypothetical protein B9Z55_028329 [Caenorhabditis nigoni]|nr:hypothetical protein B9Z55_028329 [Caenorhabditis nigoni]
MFNFQFFPLDVDFTKWEHRLRIAFDKVSVYNLHLAEILRANKPVFDALSRNPSFFKPLTLQEIFQLKVFNSIVKEDARFTTANGFEQLKDVDASSFPLNFCGIGFIDNDWSLFMPPVY